MHKTAAEWAFVRADMVTAGSVAQATNVLQMALDDIQTLAQINANLMGDDENVPRYTTRRLKQEIARALQDRPRCERCGGDGKWRRGICRECNGTGVHIREPN